MRKGLILTTSAALVILVTALIAEYAKHSPAVPHTAFMAVCAAVALAASVVKYKKRLPPSK